MKKKTVITTETREVWVIHQPSTPVDPLSSNTDDGPQETVIPTALDLLDNAAINPFKTPTAEEQD